MSRVLCRLLPSSFTACITPGVLQALSFVFKLGQRQRLLPHAPAVWAQISALLAAPAGPVASNTLARKLAIKLVRDAGAVRVQSLEVEGRGGGGMSGEGGVFRAT